MKAHEKAPLVRLGSEMAEEYIADEQSFLKGQG
jgi:hypothetical protein